MNIIKKIDESDIHKKYVKTTKRRAVRAFIQKYDKILVVFLNSVGEYKIPGGGVEPGETLYDAIKREVLEETGFTVDRIISPIGKIVHRREDFYNTNCAFEQINYYYLCSVLDKQDSLTLSGYEIELDFKPEWLDINEVINTNKKNLAKEIVPWSVRELFMLEYFRDNIKNRTGN